MQASDLTYLHLKVVSSTLKVLFMLSKTRRPNEQLDILFYIFMDLSKILVSKVFLFVFNLVSKNNV